MGNTKHYSVRKLNIVTKRKKDLRTEYHVFDS